MSNASLIMIQYYLSLLKSLYLAIFIGLLFSSSSALAGKFSAQNFLTNMEEYTSLYHVNYFMPFSYHSNKDLIVLGYPGYPSFKDHSDFSQVEINFQLSHKVLLWRLSNIPAFIYAAYTQQSYWQAYTNSPFFRGSDYSPEIFVETPLNLASYAGLVTAKLGYVHQSNGMGGQKERTWDRAYLEMQIKRGNWTLQIQPWYILPIHALTRYNPDIADYLGYFQISLKFKHKGYETMLTCRKRNFEFQQLFPLSVALQGIVKVFSGYGANLMNYNQSSINISVGIALQPG